MTSSVLFDASALIALARREEGFEDLERMLRDSISITTAVTLAEATASHAYRVGGSATTWTELFAGIVSEVVPVEATDSERAAELILDARRSGQDGGPKRSLSLGDAVCIAVAERLGLTLIGSDRAWSDLDLKVDFIPFR